MPCTGNNCTWTFDEQSNTYACIDSNESTCSLSLVFIQPDPPTDRALAQATDAIQQAAFDILSKIPPKCIDKKLFKPTFRLVPPSAEAVVLLEMTELTSKTSFLEGEDIDGTGERILAEAVNEIMQQAHNILSRIPPEGDKSPGFILRQRNTTIMLSWLAHGEMCDSDAAAADDNE